MIRKIENTSKNWSTIACY